MLKPCNCKHPIAQSFTLSQFVRVFRLSMHRDTLQERCDNGTELHGYRRETDGARILFGCLHNRAVLHIPFYPAQFKEEKHSIA